MVASCALFIAADRQAARQRRALVRADQARTLIQGYYRSSNVDAVTARLPAGAVPRRPSVAGYAVRLAALLVVGSAVSAGVAFIAG